MAQPARKQDPSTDLRTLDLIEAEVKAEKLAHPEPAVRPEALGVMTGMAAGAATGALAGPPGIVAGAVLGTALGAVAGALWREREEEDRAFEEKLDKDIGIIDGKIGEAPPNLPPAKIGAFSAAAMGAGRAGEDAGEATDAGPMSSPHSSD